MAVSRRGFIRMARSAPASWTGAVLAARGLEAHVAEAQPRGQHAAPLLPPGVDEIRISSNENPLGPGRVALNAIAGRFAEAGRYPFNSTPSEADLAAAIARRFRVTPEQVVLGAGSQEILRNAVRAFVAPGRPLVTALPTFENCTAFAKAHGLPVWEVKVDSTFRLDVEPTIAAAARGAGLVYVSNPNNPTSTVHGAKTVSEMVARIRRASPETRILIDEAYHDYVTDPAYETAVPLATSTRNVIVARTFSKAYGMAGMRIGYALGMPESLRPLAALKMPYNVSVFGIAAAVASLDDREHIAGERARNAEVRAFTLQALRQMGVKPADSQGNFLFAGIGMPAKEFREACAKRGVLVGRDFPPFEKSHCRISIGTMAEMQKATDVFRNVLGALTAAPSGGRGPSEEPC